MKLTEKCYKTYYSVNYILELTSTEFQKNYNFPTSADIWQSFQLYSTQWAIRLCTSMYSNILIYLYFRTHILFDHGLVCSRSRRIRSAVQCSVPDSEVFWEFGYLGSSHLLGNKSKVKRKISFYASSSPEGKIETGTYSVTTDHCDRKSRSATMLQRHMESIHGWIPIGEVTIPNVEEGEDMREQLNVMTAGSERHLTMCWKHIQNYLIWKSEKESYGVPEKDMRRLRKED